MDSDVRTIISGDADKASSSLKSFLSKNLQLFAFPELNQNNYRRDLWRTLHVYLKNRKMQHMHLDCLLAIRILSRDKTELNELVSDDLLNTINEHAALNDDRSFEDKHNCLVAVEALKSLCNLLFNSTVAAAISCKNGTLEGIVHKLRTYRDPKVPSDIKFFHIKILFLLTALCSELRPQLKDGLHGLTYLTETLDLILKESSGNGRQSDILTDNQVDLACEILKVLFNLTVRNNVEIDEEEEPHYFRLMAILHDYLMVKVIDEIKRHELMNHIINLLTNMPNDCYKGLITPMQENHMIAKERQFEEYDMTTIYELLEFLKWRFQKEGPASSHNELLSPILMTLLKAATSERVMRKYVRWHILPPLVNVKDRPEVGSTLRNYMCRLLTTPTSQVQNLASELLFILCKENVNRMIKHTGYGNAAGLFARRGLLGGKTDDASAYSSDSDSDTEDYKKAKHGINPVLGCYEAPRPNPMANMTEEQIEYEAMKLVDLMDNLTRKGVVKPCRIGPDGKPVPVDHVLQLQEGLQHMEDDDGGD